MRASAARLIRHSTWTLLAAVLLSASAGAQVPGPVPTLPGQTFVRTVPTQTYFLAVDELYRGEYRDAEQVFRSELRGSIKIGVATRWIDAICYHAMLGETYYHQGLPAQALDQYTMACSMFLQYPNWMLQVKFEDPRPDTNRIRTPIPWGASQRQFVLGKFSDQMQILQGDLSSASRAVQQGGVVRSLQYWQADVIEILRTLALSIRRRNELLGPLAPDDPTTRALIGALGKGAAPPNHWSNAWVDLQLGLAYVGQGKINLALKRLSRAERVAGQFDHPLTCVVLLEQGRLAMEEGKAAEADRLLTEASYSAFYYEDIGVIDEAFRLMMLNRLAAAPQGPASLLEPAARWMRRERYDHIFVRLNLAHAEELMRIGNWSAAGQAIKTAQARLRDAAAGRLGNWAQFLAARGLLQQGRDQASTVLAQAVERQATMATRNFQIHLANRWFDSRQLRSRKAVEIYHSLLEDPAAADWVFRPLETLAVLRTPHGSAFDRWIAAQFGRKNVAGALEVTDRAKRRHFHAMSPWGGRMSALRDLLEAPEESLSQEQRAQRVGLLLRIPEYQHQMQQGERTYQDLKGQWVAGLDDDGQRDLVKLWRDWATTLERREAMLATLALDRVPSEMHFPPLRNSEFVQSQLKPGQAVLVFHDTPDGLLGFLLTASDSTHWNCGPSARLNAKVATFLRDIGNYDANHELTAEELQSPAWLNSGQVLYDALLEGSSLDVGSLEELIVVPDGIVWYVPLPALPVAAQQRVLPLISVARLRVVPTLGLAVGNSVAWRRVRQSAIAGTEIVPGDNDEAKQTMLEPLRSALVRPIELPDPLPVSAPVFGSMLETLVVLDEQEIDPARPWAWSPLPAGRSSQRTALDQWFQLPQFGPQRMIFPAVRTIVENGGKASKRRQSTGAPGAELFLSTCGLMSTGAQTILLSRWRVGGQSTMELVREFVQELPHTSAADAWQRSVQLAAELPIEPSRELRVKAGKNDPPLTAAHPIFWSGYLLIDTGANAAADDDLPRDDADLGAAVGGR